MSTDRRALAISIFERGWNQGDFSLLSALLAQEFAFHVHGSTHTMGTDRLEQIITAWREGFPDLLFVTHEVVAERDLVAIRLTLTGTHLGEWNGLPPTGNRIEVDHMFLFRFEEDRVVEVWEVADTGSLRSQLETAVP